jgi:hypothetical protein
LVGVTEIATPAESTARLSRIISPARDWPLVGPFKITRVMTCPSPNIGW